MNPTPIAVITGGGSGLGQASATQLAHEGYHPVILDLPSSPGPGVAEDLQGSFYPVDVAQPAQVSEAFAHAAHHGEIRVVVACAGVATPGRLLPRHGRGDLSTITQVVSINLLGTIATLEAAAHHMSTNTAVDDERGVVVLTASVAAFEGQIGQVAYSASKGGVAALTLPAARELARVGIRVVTIAPGTFATPMLSGLKPEVQQALSEQIPHPSRLGRPQEYAQLVSHIVANQMLNGEVIRLDGALRMPPR